MIPSSSTNASSSSQQPQHQQTQPQTQAQHTLFHQMLNNNYRNGNTNNNNNSSNNNSNRGRTAHNRGIPNNRITTSRSNRARRRGSNATSTSPYPLNGSTAVRPSLLPTFHHNTLYFAERSRQIRSSLDRSPWENQIFCGGLSTSGQLGIRKHPSMPEDEEQWLNDDTRHIWSRGSPCSPDRFMTAMGSQLDLFSSAVSCIEEVNRIALGPTLHHMGDPVLHKVPRGPGQSRDIILNQNNNNNNSSVYLNNQCKIVMIEAGWYHTLVLDSLGRVFSCGAGYGFQNGRAINANIDYFCQIELDEPIDFVACGGHHNLLITKYTREIISFGEGRDGQLGFGTIQSSKPRRAFIRDQNGSLIRFKSAFGGGYHSVLLDENYNVYTFGRGGHGQLGIAFDTESTEMDTDFFHDRPTLVNRFQAIDSLTGLVLTTYDNTQINIVHCSAGAAHTVFVTDDGRVFGCGDAQYGQLSLQHPSPEAHKQRFLVPTLIDDLKAYKIVSAGCGYFHSAFISSNGEIFTCGWNAYGNCGTGSETTCKTVYKLDMFGSLKVSSVKCGWNFTCCLTSNGSVYAFGELKHAQLPVSPNDTALSRIQSSPVLKTPRLLECFEHLPIAMIACGRGHTMYVTGYNQEIRGRGEWFLSQRACVHFQDIDITCTTTNNNDTQR